MIQIKKNIAYILIFTLILISIPYSHSYAASSGPISSDIQVRLIGDRAGEIGNYIISFTNEATALTGGMDKLSVQFPAGTIFSNSTITSDSILVNGKPLSSAPTINGQVVELVLPNRINQNEFVTVEVLNKAGIVNTTQVGSKTLDLTVSIVDPADSTIITATYQSTSKPFIITGSQITAPTFTLTNTGTGKSSDATIQFKGALVENDIIDILYPLDFTRNNGTIPSTYVQVNGKAAKKVEMKNHLPGTGAPTEKRRLEITVPNGVSTQSNQVVSVTISSNANILNPTTIGNYNLEVYTSRDIVPQPTISVNIQNQVSNVTVQVSPNKYREAGEYTIKFRTTGAVTGSPAGNSGYIEVIFPNDTVLPATISSGYVLLNNSLAGSVLRDSSNTKMLRIYLANGTSFAPLDHVTLLISSRANIQNPSEANNHSIQVRTSTDQSFATSGTYTTTGGSSTTPGTPGTGSGGTGTSTSLKLSSYEANAASRYEIVYLTGSSGALIGGTDEISILFGNSTQLPDFIDRELIRVNSVPLDTGMVRISNQLISFRLPSKINVAANQSVTITLDEKAQILHSNKEGNYYLYVMTTKDPSSVPYGYSVKGQASYGFYVQPDYDSDNQIGRYVMTFKTNLTGSLTGGYDWISLALPKAVTRTQLVEALAIDLNGYSLDMNKVQVSGQTISFFVPDNMNISRDTEVYIDITDPKKLLSYSGTRVITNTITFKIMTSKDNTWVESNLITLFKQTAPGNPTTPTQPTNPVPTQPNPSTGTPAVGKKFQLTLGKKDAYIDGKKQTVEAAPFAVKGNTLVPLRFISEGLGAKVDYKPNGQKITITYGDKYMVLTVNSDIVVKQGGGERLPVPVQAVNNRSFVPLRFISEWMGLTVEWNQKEQSIILQK